LPVKINNQKYYRISDVCRMTNVSRTTIWRWTKSGIFEDAVKRDRRGWRLFTVVDIKKIKAEARRVE
jgi:DNA-binding transcriptional MerR regulator